MRFFTTEKYFDVSREFGAQINLFHSNSIDYVINDEQLQEYLTISLIMGFGTRFGVKLHKVFEILTWSKMEDF